MADKQISALTEATSVDTSDLFVLEQSSQAKKLTGQTLISELAAALDGHGGIASISWQTSGTAGDGQLHTGTITYADATTSTITIRDGYKGDTGAQTYVWIKYSPVANPSDANMSDEPDKYIGIHTGTEALAPTTAASYTWFLWKGDTGDKGTGITSIIKTSTSGVVDTYTITFDDATTETFAVTNGSNISSITKTGTAGLVDTYTVALTNGGSSTFTVTNGKGISSITMVSGSHAAGTTDTYRILFNDGDTFDFQIYNGANGTGAVSTVAGIGVSGNTGDVPLILWGNGAPTTATVGQEKQLYFNKSSGIMYICLGESGGTYSWASMGITVDQTFSSSSDNPLANKIITAKIGTGTLNTTAQNIIDAINELKTTKQDATGVGLAAYPVGSIYMSVNSASPGDLFGGTWERISGKFLLASTDGGSSGASQAAGNTGGNATHTITTDEMPTHNHSVNQQYLHRLDSSDNNYANYGAGGSLAGWGIQTTTNNQGATRLGIQAFNTNDNGSGDAMDIMPPYLSVYVWKRTA